MKKMMIPAFAMMVAMTLVGCCGDKVNPPPPPPPQPHLGNPIIEIRVSAKNAAEKPLAESLKVKLEEDAIRRQFAIAPGRKADATLEVVLSSREAAKLQDWRTYEGDATIRVTTEVDDKLIATTSVAAAGKRGLDEPTAMASLGAELTAKVLSWFDKNVHPNAIPKLPDVTK